MSTPSDSSSSINDSFTASPIGPSGSSHLTANLFPSIGNSSSSNGQSAGSSNGRVEIGSGSGTSTSIITSQSTAPASAAFDMSLFAGLFEKLSTNISNSINNSINNSIGVKLDQLLHVSSSSVGGVVNKNKRKLVRWNMNKLLLHHRWVVKRRVDQQHLLLN